MLLNVFTHGHFYVVCMGFLLYLWFAGVIGMNFSITQKNLVVIQGLAVWSPIFVMLWMTVVSLILVFRIRNSYGVINATKADLVQERIDRCVCNLAWRQLFPDSKLLHLPFWRSDHKPILLNIIEVVPAIASSGGEDEGCRNLIVQAWKIQGRGLTGVNTNIALCASSLATWYTKHKQAKQKEIYIKKTELHGLSSTVNPQSWTQIHRVEGQLDNLMKSEELYWRQRSRVEWLHSGDKNTKFFHMKAMARRSRNLIHGLCDSSGS
ncbi:hypothetical protein ACOSQ3_007702 [Xanthoceras sorbifolium]